MLEACCRFPRGIIGDRPDLREAPGRRHRAATMMESGPVGGIIASAEVGRALGFPNVIAFDMGGTTAKASLIRDGEPTHAEGYYVGGYARGDPVILPVVDVVEPGPICYGRGGRMPTDYRCQRYPPPDRCGRLPRRPDASRPGQRAAGRRGLPFGKSRHAGGRGRRRDPQDRGQQNVSRGAGSLCFSPTCSFWKTPPS